MNQILKRAIINSLGNIVYIILVVSFMSFLQSYFPGEQDKKTIIIPIAMLLLFVCSAAITGLLVLGKPAMLYLDGKKKEAVSLLGYTLSILVLTTVIAFIFLILYI